jgi:hypothetical protein
LTGDGAVDPSTHVWFLDLGGNRLFPAPADSAPPIDAPSGPAAGVLAHVFSCGNCNEPDREIAYLERWTAEGRSRTNERRAEDIEVASPGKLQWFAASSPDGQRVMAATTGIAKRCRDKGVKARRCVPQAP